MAATAAAGLTPTFNSPCAACKFLRRKCQPDCVFAPYFPPDQPNKFAHVHKVFGASNVTKLLNDLNPCRREDAVNSLAYEAEMRLRDPVYGCVGVIYALKHELDQINIDLNRAQLELFKYRTSASAAATLAMGGNLPAGADQMTIGGGGLRNMFEREQFLSPTYAQALAECGSSINQYNQPTVRSYYSGLAARVGFDAVGVGGSGCDSDELSAMNYMPISQQQQQQHQDGQFHNPRIFDGGNDWH